MQGLLGLLTAADEVNIHSAQDNNTLDDVLPVRVNAHEIQTIVQNTNDQSLHSSLASSSTT